MLDEVHGVVWKDFIMGVLFILIKFDIGTIIYIG